MAGRYPKARSRENSDINNTALQGSLVYVDLDLPVLRDALNIPPGQSVSAADKITTEVGKQVRVIVTAGTAPLANSLIDSFPNLALVVSIAAGHDGIDLDHCRARGVRVSCSVGVNAADVADIAVGGLVALVRGLVSGDRLVREGGWYRERLVPTRSVGTLRAGIVGLGSIGVQIARRMDAFGCSVAWHGPRDKDVDWPRMPSITDLAAWSDALFLAAPLTDATRGLVDRRVLEALGPRGYLVNVGRGAMVDEDALIEFLRAERIAGAVLDVFAEEPTPAERWANVPNTLLTPHHGGATHEALYGVVVRAAESVRRGLAGERPEGLVV